MTTMAPTHYEILGISPDADDAAVKAAYRKAARSAHPDSGGDAEQFRLVREAYECLSDQLSRAAYDARIAAPAPKPGDPSAEYGGDRTTPGQSRWASQKKAPPQDSPADAGAAEPAPPPPPPRPSSPPRSQQPRAAQTPGSAGDDDPWFTRTDDPPPHVRPATGPLATLGWTAVTPSAVAAAAVFAAVTAALLYFRLGIAEAVYAGFGVPVLPFRVGTPSLTVVVVAAVAAAALSARVVLWAGRGRNAALAFAAVVTAVLVEAVATLAVPVVIFTVFARGRRGRTR